MCPSALFAGMTTEDSEANGEAEDGAPTTDVEADDDVAADERGTGDGSAPGDGGGDPTSISNIERIVLDPDELVEAIAYNGQEDIGLKEKAVFSLTPPFGETVRPALRHIEEDSTESEADGEIHMRPFRFVAEGRQVIDQRPTRQLATEQLGAEDPSESAIEAWIDEAMATWKAHVRENLAESVDIFSSHGMAIVAVEFEPAEE